MGVIDDYINGLEQQDNPDVQKIVKDLYGLHNQEIETTVAKVSELESSIAQRDAAIAERDREVQRWKAQNFDLAMQVSGGTMRRTPDNENDEKPTGDRINVSDLFTPNVRMRHFNG